MLARWVSFPPVLDRVGREVGESVVRIVGVVEQNALGGLSASPRRRRVRTRWGRWGRGRLRAASPDDFQSGLDDPESGVVIRHTAPIARSESEPSQRLLDRIDLATRQRLVGHDAHSLDDVDRVRLALPPRIGPGGRRRSHGRVLIGCARLATLGGRGQSFLQRGHSLAGIGWA